MAVGMPDAPGPPGRSRPARRPAPPRADLGDAGLAAALLALLHAVGDRGADLAAVAREAAGRVDVGDQDGALEVLEELVDAGESEAARL